MFSFAFIPFFQRQYLNNGTNLSPAKCPDAAPGKNEVQKFRIWNCLSQENLLAAVACPVLEAGNFFWVGTVPF